MEATCNALSRQYHGTEDADEKGRIRTELAEAVGEAFERRQEDAQKRVEEMEARINEIREALEQRMANRDSICELRLEELTRDPKLTWDPGL